MADSLFSVEGVKSLIDPKYARERAALARQQSATQQVPVQSSEIAQPQSTMQQAQPNWTTTDQLQLVPLYNRYSLAEQVAGRQPKEMNDWINEMRMQQSQQQIQQQ